MAPSHQQWQVKVYGDPLLKMELILVLILKRGGQTQTIIIFLNLSAVLPVIFLLQLLCTKCFGTKAFAIIPGFSGSGPIFWFFSSNLNESLLIYICYVFWGYLCLPFAIFKGCVWAYAYLLHCLRILVPFSMPSVRWTLNTRSRLKTEGLQHFLAKLPTSPWKGSHVTPENSRNVQSLEVIIFLSWKFVKWGSLFDPVRHGVSWLMFELRWFDWSMTWSNTSKKHTTRTSNGMKRFILLIYYHVLFAKKPLSANLGFSQIQPNQVSKFPGLELLCRNSFIPCCWVFRRRILVRLSFSRKFTTHLAHQFWVSPDRKGWKQPPPKSPQYFMYQLKDMMEGNDVQWYSTLWPDWLPFPSCIILNLEWFIRMVGHQIWMVGIVRDWKVIWNRRSNMIGSYFCPWRFDFLFFRMVLRSQVKLMLNFNDGKWAVSSWTPDWFYTWCLWHLSSFSRYNQQLSYAILSILRFRNPCCLKPALLPCVRRLNCFFSNFWTRLYSYTQVPPFQFQFCYNNHKLLGTSDYGHQPGFEDHFVFYVGDCIWDGLHLLYQSISSKALLDLIAPPNPTRTFNLNLWVSRVESG